MLKLTAIFLSNTLNDSIFEMTKNCIHSMIEAEKNNTEMVFEVILVESNRSYLTKGYKYDDDINIILPDEVFNFHRFLNFGIKEATGDYIALCNNDLIFNKDWFSEILKVKKTNPEISSFSPYDKNSNKIPKAQIDANNLIKGYEIQKHLTGWCFIVEADTLKLIGNLDERFDFYYADNDYAMSLRKYNITHALVCNSKVLHLGGKVTKMVIEDKVKFEKPPAEIKNIPKYVTKGKMFWILNDVKMVDGVIKFHKKWGHRKTIKLKLLIIGYLLKYKLGYLNRYILN